MTVRLDRLPPLTVEVDCSGVRHRITWRRGEFVLHDHDLEAERVAERLGGDLPFCLAAREAITQDVDHLSLVGEPETNPRRRGLEQQVPHAGWSPGARFAASGMHRRAHAQVRALADRAEMLRTLWGLPASLRHRLVLAKVLSAAEPDLDAIRALRSLEKGAALDNAVFKVIARGIPRPPPPTDDDERILARFFDGLTLIEIPAQASKRRVVLQRLAREFEPGRQYTEREVSRLLSAFHPDFAALRRYMVDEGLLERDRGVYRRVEEPTRPPRA